MTAPGAALLAAWQSEVTNPEAHVYVAWDGVTFEDETDYLLKVGGVYSVDPDSRMPGISTATIVLDNQDGRFSPFDFSGPLFPYLGKAGQPVRIETGYAGNIVRMGTYWITNLAPSEKDRTVSLSVQDRWGVLSEVEVVGAADMEVRTDNAFRMIADAGGLVEGRDYTCEVGVNTCVTVLPNGKMTRLFALVAQAEGGRVYVDADGVIRFENRTTVQGLTVPLWEIRRSTQAFEIRYRRKDPSRANQILLRAAQRNVQVEEPVGESTCITWAYAAADDGLVYPVEDWAEIEGKDPYTGEVGKVELTTIHSIEARRFNGISRTPPWTIDRTGTVVTLVNSAPPAGGLTPSDTIYYLWEPSGTKGKLRLWSCRTGYPLVVWMEPNGKPWRIFPAVTYGADDKDAQAESGVVGTLSFDNDFVPLQAGRLVRDLLASRIAARAGADVPLVDGMPWARPGDCFDLIDDSVSPAEIYRMQILSHEWSIDGPNFSSGVSTVGLDTLLMDPAPYVQTFVVAPSGTPTSGTDQAPPWTWGPAGQVATADTSDWG